jgi:hypothetical protein
MPSLFDSRADWAAVISDDPERYCLDFLFAWHGGAKRGILEIIGLLRLR